MAGKDKAKKRHSPRRSARWRGRAMIAAMVAALILFALIPVLCSNAMERMLYRMIFPENGYITLLWICWGVGSAIAYGLIMRFARPSPDIRRKALQILLSILFGLFSLPCIGAGTLYAVTLSIHDELHTIVTEASVEKVQKKGTSRGSAFRHDYARLLLVNIENGDTVRRHIYLPRNTVPQVESTGQLVVTYRDGLFGIGITQKILVIEMKEIDMQ